MLEFPPHFSKAGSLFCPSRRYSRVLVYDWSEPGDAEVVVEDIENLNLDDIDYYDDQQSDWRFHNEAGASVVRYK